MFLLPGASLLGSFSNDILIYQNKKCRVVVMSCFCKYNKYITNERVGIG